MAGRLTPLGVALKWFLVPISLGAIGYFLVGPRVENRVPKDIKDKVQEVASTVSNGGEKPVDSEPQEPKRVFAEPQVDVTVTALNSRENKPKKKRRKKRKPPAETPSPSSEPPVAAPPSDGGGTAEPSSPG